jgi:hypothetical protein
VGSQVGDGDTDHYCWQRPEDMTTSRQAYRVDKDNPGSDLAGETAAALAAASIVFRRSNPHYSHLLLHHAQQVSSVRSTITLLGLLVIIINYNETHTHHCSCRVSNP